MRHNLHGPARFKALSSRSASQNRQKIRAFEALNRHRASGYRQGAEVAVRLRFSRKLTLVRRIHRIVWEER